MWEKIKKVIKLIYKVLVILYSLFIILGILVPSEIYVTAQDKLINKIQSISMFVLTVPLLFFIGGIFGCFNKFKILSNRKLKFKISTIFISTLISFILIGVMFNITSSKYSEEYVQIMKERTLEKEKKKQEELAKAEEEKKKQEELAKDDEENKNQEELAKAEEEKKKQEELAKAEEEKNKQEELAKAEEEKKKQEELAKQEENKNEELTINDSEFKSAIGNLYTGVTLYAEENGQMEPYFTVIKKGENVSNPGSSLIKNGVLVKEITSGDTYWKDVDKMIKDSLSDEQYIIKYYVKKDDPCLP